MLGNSKTTKNNNSSRFGKYISLYIKNNKINGCKIVNYILEKSRVTSYIKNEKSYHIFYTIDHHLLKKYNFKNNYELISSTNNELIENFKSPELFIQSLKQFSFMDYEIDCIFYKIKIILELLDISCIDNIKPVIISLTNEFKKINIDINSIIELFTSKKITIQNECITSKINIDDSKIIIKSYCEDLYYDLFNEIIDKINNHFNKSFKISKNDSTLSILDIFGFEIFENNGFEQLCINYTNEILQNIYNNNILENEQCLYNKENVPWNYIDYNKNNMIINLIDSNKSIFSYINEYTILGNKSDTTLYNILDVNLSEHPNFNINNKIRAYNKFIITHYAGDVTYTVKEYIKKNSIKSKGRYIKTNLHLFKNQLNLLCSELNNNKCRFIRCIKPNDTLSSNSFNYIKVHEQLLFSGIIEGINILIKGYPIKIDISSLDKEFVYLTYKKIAISELLKKYILNKEYSYGKTKLFLKNEVYRSLLNKNRNIKIEIVTYLNKNIRCWLNYKKYINLIKNIICIQSYVRTKNQLKKYIELIKKRSANIIINQCILYIYKLRRIKKLENIKYIQSIFRKYLAIKLYFTKKIKYKATHVIQSFILNIVYKKRIQNKKNIKELNNKILKSYKKNNQLESSIHNLKHILKESNNKSLDIKNTYEKQINDKNLEISQLKFNNLHLNESKKNIKKDINNLKHKLKETNNKTIDIENKYKTELKEKNIQIKKLTNILNNNVENLKTDARDLSNGTYFNNKINHKYMYSEIDNSNKSIIDNIAIDEMNHKMEKMYIELRNKEEELKNKNEYIKSILENKKSIWDFFKNIL